MAGVEPDYIKYYHTLSNTLLVISMTYDNAMWLDVIVFDGKLSRIMSQLNCLLLRNVGFQQFYEPNLYRKSAIFLS
jgi:hypothetical protein